MNTDAIIQYYDDLMRLAVSKCGSQTEAEDLVSDTMLAAFSYINKGGRIEHPKTWLANTLCHKYSDSLRKKYRAPITVNFDDAFEIPDEEEEYFSSQDEAKIRKELIHLAYIAPEQLTLNEKLFRLNLSSRQYYRLHDQAVNILSLRLWAAPSKGLDSWLELLTLLENLH